VPNGLGPPGLELSPEQKRALRREWGLPEQGRLLGFVGRLAPEKAPERFLQTLSRLDAEDSLGVFCGEGPLETPLRSLAESLGMRAE